MTLKSSLSKLKRIRTFKATDHEWEEIEKKAEMFTKGNISEWIRYAAIELEPKPSDLVLTKKIK